MDVAAARRRSLSPGLAFLLVGGFCGALLVFITPPLHWGDENTHFVHAYRLSELSFALTQIDDEMMVSLPSGVGKLLVVLAFERKRLERTRERISRADAIKRLAIAATPDQRRLVDLDNATYPPLGYVPQALGIALTRLFTSSVLLQLYGARLANLLVWLVLVWAAIRVSALFKLALAVLALAPMSVFVAATCAVDPLVNGLGFLWSAWVIRLAVAQRPSRAALIALGVLAVTLALLKVLYAPLILLLLAVPPERFGGRRRQLAVVAAMLFASALCLAVWLLFARWQIAQGIAHRGSAAFAHNLALLTRDPLGSAALLADTVLVKSRLLIFHLHQTHWGRPLAPDALLWLWLASVAAAVLAEQRRRTWPTLAARAVALAAVLLTLSAVALVAFLFWSESGARVIRGVQGRYAIPLLPALLIVLGPPALRFIDRRARAGLSLVALTLVIGVLAYTVQRGLRLYQ